MRNLIRAIKVGLLPAVLLTLLIIGYTVYEILAGTEVSIFKVLASIVFVFVYNTIISYRKED